MEKVININNNLINDLNVKREIYNKLNNCVTRYGSDTLSNYYINNIIIDQNILSKRSEILKKIINSNNTKLIKKKLKKIKLYEDLIEKWRFNDIQNELIFQNEYLNKSFILNISNKMKFYYVILYPLIYVIIYGFFKYFGFSIDFVSYIKSIYFGYINTISFFISLLISNEFLITSIAYLLGTCYSLYQIYSIYNMFQGGITHYNICSNFENEYYQLINILNVINDIFEYDISKEIINVTYSHQKIREDPFKCLESLKDDFQTKNLGEIILAFINREYKFDITHVLDYLGHIDANICISELLTKGYSLPQYEINDKPFIIVENMFHPLLSNNQIKNSAIIGDPNIMIITGPNKAGKSTFMKTLILSIYLAQSIGVTCCEKLVFTPFCDMYTYLNIPDNIGRESLFEAEVNRCFNLYDKINKLKDNQFIFCIIDELFTGTNPPEGISSSYAICKKMTECKNALLCISTHFYNICTLNNVIYKKFIANKVNNIYQFPYKIYDGISNQYIAIELLKEKGYDNDIIEYALNKLNLVILS